MNEPSLDNHMKHPNSNIQHPENIQAPNTNIGAWTVGASLELGAWTLGAYLRPANQPLPRPIRQKTPTPIAPQPATFNLQPAAHLPRLIHLIALFAHPTDRGAGDTVNRWMKNRFAAGKRSPKNNRFLSRLATGCACASRVEVLNRKYPFPSKITVIQAESR